MRKCVFANKLYAKKGEKKLWTPEQVKDQLIESLSEKVDDEQVLLEAEDLIIIWRVYRVLRCGRGQHTQLNL